ncbi:hypothetical protein [Nostoc sp.]|uniref:hypothetical protein n=1 Tax=Nostoc sp. TaxID=1180 RepID=UPI002FF9E5E2
MQPAVGIALTVRYINEIERTIFMRVIPTAGGAIAWGMKSWEQFCFSVELD